MFCKSCGTQLPDNTEFCTNCGARNPSTPQVVQQNPPIYPDNYSQPNMQYKPKKKGKGCIIALISFIVVVGLIVGGLALALPGLFKPASLGVKFDESDYTTALSKLGYTKDKSPDTGTAKDYNNIYGPIHQVDTTLTSAEVSALMAINRPNYYALKNIQVKLNPDGTIEATGKLSLEYVMNQVLGGMYTKDQIQKQFPMIGLLPKTLNFYSKFEGKIASNAVEGVKIDSVKLQGISVPVSLISSDDATAFVEDVMTSFLQVSIAKSGTGIDLIENVGGNLAISGQFPSSLTRVPVTP